MASSMAVPRSTRSAGSGIGKNIPLITHPMANKGDMSDLTIRGTSSLSLNRQRTDLTGSQTKNSFGIGTNRANAALNNERENDGIPTGRKSCPERMLQWPPGKSCK